MYKLCTFILQTLKILQIAIPRTTIMMIGTRPHLKTYPLAFRNNRRMKREGLGRQGIMTEWRTPMRVIKEAGVAGTGQKDRVGVTGVGVMIEETEAGTQIEEVVEGDVGAMMGLQRGEDVMGIEVVEGASTGVMMVVIMTEEAEEAMSVKTGGEDHQIEVVVVDGMIEEEGMIIEDMTRGVVEEGLREGVGPKEGVDQTGEGETTGLAVGVMTVIGVEVGVAVIKTNGIGLLTPPVTRLPTLTGHTKRTIGGIRIMTIEVKVVMAVAIDKIKKIATTNMNSGKIITRAVMEAVTGGLQGTKIMVTGTGVTAETKMGGINTNKTNKGMTNGLVTLATGKIVAMRGIIIIIIIKTLPMLTWILIEIPETIGINNKGRRVSINTRMPILARILISRTVIIITVQTTLANHTWSRCSLSMPTRP